MNLQRSGPKLTPIDIVVFEREIDGELPDDYKQFLLKHNGGMAKPPLGFRWNAKINKVPGFDILLLTHETGLRRGLRNLRQLGVDGYLPVTSTQNEEDICLDFRNKIGSISLALYSRDHGIPMEAFITPLANSFTEFIDSLFEIPEVYCPIEELGEKGTPDDLDVHLAEGNSIDALGKNDLPILGEAIKFNNMPVIKACLEHGASLSGSIHMATYNRRPEIIKLLFDSGADINEQDRYGDRPLSYIGGTSLPGDEGLLNRRVRDMLISLGATK
jgi:hypothetical protein